LQQKEEKHLSVFPIARNIRGGFEATECKACKL